MRKVVLFMHISLDGFGAGPNGELDWLSYAEEIVSTVGSPMYGRVTYQMMESYWPTVLDDASATKHDMEHARWLEDVEKIVFSTTLERTEWKNTKVIKDNIAAEVSKLKQEPGKDLVIFGSPGLGRQLMKLGLIDAYRLTVNPVILGKGKPLFEDVEDTINLKLVNTKTFESGVVALHYETQQNNRRTDMKTVTSKDGTIMGDTMSGKPLSAEKKQQWALVTMPVLVMTGGNSEPFFHDGAQALVDVLPNAEHRTLEGQDHAVTPEALAPVLAAYFKD